MSDSEVVAGRKASVRLRTRGRGKTRAHFPERRRSPRPRLAEIRRGASLTLMPPMVVTGAVRMIEFLLVAALGFTIYLGYVEREAQSAHLIYLGVALTAAAANTLMLQTFDLYSVPALTAFVRSFTRIALAWTLVVAGLMAGAFFGKVGAEFSRVWIATSPPLWASDAAWRAAAGGGTHSRARPAIRRCSKLLSRAPESACANAPAKAKRAPPSTSSRPTTLISACANPATLSSAATREAAAKSP